MTERRSARKAKLAWSKREQRWRFRYRNRNYAVSPKQLDCENTVAASKEAAERWRDLRIAETDRQDYLRSAGALELLVSLEHALRQRKRMERIGHKQSARAWSNIVQVIQTQLVEQRGLKDNPAFAVDDDNGIIDIDRSSFAERAKALLLSDDQIQQQRFAERFELSDEQLADMSATREGMNGDAAGAGVRPTYEELVAENRRLKLQIQELTLLVEKLRRECKRQAAPFRKQDEPVAEPKKSGRRSGRRHGPHVHRVVPPRIDETYDVPLPEKCSHCGGLHVRETHVASQYQTEIPRTVIYRQFDMHIGVCGHCGHAVQGRHVLQRAIRATIDSARPEPLPKILKI